MRGRVWLTGLLLAVACVAQVPAPARAAFWPFSLFAKKTPVKRTKPKPGKKQPGTRVKVVKPAH